MTDSEILLCNLEEAQEIVKNKLEKDDFISIDELMYKITNKTPVERMLDGSFGWGSIDEPVNFELFKEES